jgi:hypothetical protein
MLPFGWQSHLRAINRSGTSIVGSVDKSENAILAGGIRLAYRRVVVDSVLVWVVAGLPGVETSVPLVSFSIVTPFRLAVRLVVIVTSSCCVGAMAGVVTVVELEDDDDCAKPTPDINVRAVVAANKILNMMHSPRNLWRAESLA